MKGTYLGEFQEVVLLSVLILGEEAYGVRIQEEIQHEMKRVISRGALHTALTRLVEKGFLTSKMGEATRERGGRRKRLYLVTNLGKDTLREVRLLRQQLWQKVPGWALNITI
ncbi:PadR family transcriptional regulator [Fulvivirga sp. M361]|uniref:PadR family transcriptional regulator n=1 Tax=Fulvivirga sp. M361 TaxID=2594266 RepID=UPI00117A201D|nr:helix-turn-helix transcriptional regulator [Fulvivirga sp. M361]TRX51287.1 PadR family transcriptional regulator [Fulvivirga sp. M361]